MEDNIACNICNITFKDKYILKRHLQRDAHNKKLIHFTEMAESKKAKIDKKEGLLARTEEYQADAAFRDEQIFRVLQKEELLKSEKVNETIAEFETELEEMKASLRPKKSVVDNFYTGIFLLF
jgi:uncharacterized Rmd1/YagE family protein